ncbi:hypothetical protein HF313_11830 [Massilia atriviolacea]|uniref:DUF3829 domain-containing protein n=1 Tax=Massilia atriviolacea TaxID=2495579 RepID=A0A430HIV2_9BURK|nr:hypothetical protein [Massilia atriviolacea]RSZ57419.1 hypothetical protein EJB06_19955 [Massilia atriviolacea]
MNALRTLSTSTLLAASLLLGGCASNRVNLEEVREFADASARLGGYAELSARYRDTYLREQPYLPAAADKAAKENDARRHAAYNDFVTIQKAVVAYMQTLSALAGEARYDFTPQIDTLGVGLSGLSETTLGQKQVSAYTGLARLLTRALTSRYQKDSVETMVRDGDADLRVLLDAMLSLTDIYAAAHENEKKTVLGFFEVALPLAERPQDRLLYTLARAHVQAKTSEYRLVDRRIDLARQGLAKVALGHQKLRENLATMSSSEMRRMLSDLVRDLRLIRAGLATD